MKINPLPGSIRTAEWRLTFTREDQLELTRRSDAEESTNLVDSFTHVADSLKRAYDAWFSPLLSVEIPPIPVGEADSVIIPAHEGFLSGDASYYWSGNGWSNDWVHRLDSSGSSIRWPLDITTSSSYDCYVKYTSRANNETVRIELQDQLLRMELPLYIPVIDRNYNRIDRSAEAIGQSWERVYMGKLDLEAGISNLTLNATNQVVEILSVVLIKI